MNRHQRRAAAKSGQETRVPAGSTAGQQSGEKGEANQFAQAGGKAESEVTLVDLSDLDISFSQDGEGADRNFKPAVGAAAGKQNQASPKRRSGLLMRWFSRLLLSRWVLARVSNPEVERLLMLLALESNRKDVADELTRREALRGINAKPRR